MQRTDRGMISKVFSDSIEIILDQDNDCANCPLADNCKKNEIIIIKTDKAGEYKEGERIDVIVYASRKILLQVYIFIMPIIALLIGVIVGKIIFRNEELSVISGAGFFVVSLFIFVFISKKKNVILYKIKE